MTPNIILKRKQDLSERKKGTNRGRKRIRNSPIKKNLDLNKEQQKNRACECNKTAKSRSIYAIGTP